MSTIAQPNEHRPANLSIGSSVSYNPAAKTNITASRKIYMQTTLNSFEWKSFCPNDHSFEWQQYHR